MSYCGTGYGSHDYDNEGICSKCGDYDEDFDESLEDEDGEWVDKDWNGRHEAIEVEKKWLDRAIALIHEHQIVAVEDAYKIVEILERESGNKPYDQDIANTVVIALRETKDQREVMAAIIAAKAKPAVEQPAPDLPKVGVRKGQRKKLVAA